MGSLIGTVFFLTFAVADSVRVYGCIRRLIVH